MGVGVGGGPVAPGGELEGEELELSAGFVDGGAGDGFEGELGEEGFLFGVGVAVEEESVGVVEEAGDAELGVGVGAAEDGALPERGDQVTAMGSPPPAPRVSLMTSWTLRRRMG